MKTALASKRHLSGSAWLAFFLVVIVVIFLGLFITLMTRCAKVPIRELDENDDTNSMMEASFTWNSTIPLRAAPSEPEHSGVTNVFEATVQFLWEDCLTNGVLVILRSFDWQEWAMLYNVMFGAGQDWTNVVMVNAYGQRSTNLVTTIRFLDMDAPEEQAFYMGLIITNSP